MLDNDYIYEVYKELSFSKAAKNLYITQPALSATVKKVEKKLGITIFDRTKSPIGVTDEGKVYIDSIIKIKVIEDETLNKLKDMTNLDYGTLKLCGDNFISSNVYPICISEFKKKYPKIEVELTETNSPFALELLNNETIDLIIAHGFDKNLYNEVKLYKEMLLLAVPISFSINEKLKEYRLTQDDILDGSYLNKKLKSINIDYFKDERFILLKKGNDSRIRADKMFNERKIEPTNVVIYLDQLVTVYNMIQDQIGIGFVTDEMIKKTTANNCYYYKINSEHVNRYTSIGYKKNKYQSKAMKAFIDICLNIYK